MHALPPTSISSMGVSSHPWITARCRDAIKAKHNAVGTDDYVNKCDMCSLVLKEEFDKYALEMKGRLHRLRRGSKRCWSL